MLAVQRIASLRVSRFVTQNLFEQIGRPVDQLGGGASRSWPACEPSRSGMARAHVVGFTTRCPRPGAHRPGRSLLRVDDDGPRHPTDETLVTQRRVRSRLPPPPPSLRLQRLCGRTPRPTQKLPRFRGVLGEGHSRIGTGDGEFQADGGQRAALISVAKFGGSDSPHRECWGFEFHSLRQVESEVAQVPPSSR